MFGKKSLKTIDCSLVTVYMTTVSLSVVVQRLWCILYSNKEKFNNKSINDQVCHCSWYRWMFRHGSLLKWNSLPADLSGDFSCFESPTARFLCKFKVIQYLALSAEWYYVAITNQYIRLNSKNAKGNNTLQKLFNAIPRVSLVMWLGRPQRKLGFKIFFDLRPDTLRTMGYTAPWESAT